MKTIELFSGTQSFSKVMRKYGHDTFCVDNNEKFDNDLNIDIFNLHNQYLPQPINLLWASPPCTSFSVASIGKHWNKDHTPKSAQAVLGKMLLDQTINIISYELERNPNMVWFIENPRGKMRKVIDSIFEKYGIKAIRHTITYCQYGDNRMKPTDIWTNSKTWIPRSMCKNGDSCHVSAPRGSKTGTQGLKGNMERSVIPPQLFEEILDHINALQR